MADGTENEGHITVEVMYGPSARNFEVETGTTVGTVLDNPYIREIIGFGNTGQEQLLVNGRPAGRETALAAKDRVEVVKYAGEKAR